MYLLILPLLLTLFTSSLADPHEGKLYAILLDEYEPLERPVENSSNPVVVKMGVALQQIIAVDEKNQLVDVNAWLKFTWHDYHLVWDPEEHGGVYDLRFRKNQLWTPDILMYNSADPQFDSSFASNVLVYPDGTTNWIPPGENFGTILRMSCTIQIVWFPFDMQYCTMKFGSWTFDGSKLDLQIDENAFDTSNYMANGEWRLVDTKVQRNIQFYECCPEPYYDLMFTFVIHRRSLYYAFNLILPCILITMLTLIGFTLPPDAGEKMSLQITIMLSICIFQNYVTELSPPTSEAIPFLGAFFALCMFTCAGSVVFTTLALNLHHRNSKSHEMSDMFRWIMLEWLPYFLLMRRPGHKAKRRGMRKIQNEEGEKTKMCISALLSKIFVDSPVSTHRWKSEDDESELSISERYSGDWAPSFDSKKEKRTPVPAGQLAQLLILQQIYYSLSSINRRFEEEEEEKEIEDDWKFASMVVDRGCLFTFSAFIVFATCSLFMAVPKLTETLL